MTPDEAEALCREMNAAREAKDYDKSDSIRQQILDAGFNVQQTPDGATIKKDWL